jgi:hypothetical protein
MGITVTEDEADKKFRGVSEGRKDVVKRHAHDADAAQEFQARSLEIEHTALRDPDPAKAYHLTDRRRDGEIIARKQGLGYEITDPKGKTKLINGVVKDDAQIMGDLVLMETPIENYEKRKQMKAEKWARMSMQRMDQAKEKINQIARDGGLISRHKNAAVDE